MDVGGVLGFMKDRLAVTGFMGLWLGVPLGFLPLGFLIFGLYCPSHYCPSDYCP